MSGSSVRTVLALLPGGYFLTTRVAGLRDGLYHVATSFLPAVWFLYRSSDLSLPESGWTFVLGYLAFISAYELGYLANDLWDARRDPAGRRRGFERPGTLLVASFVAIRFASWAAVGWATGWLFEPIWLAGFAALAVVFALHNGIRSPTLRSTSFFQLAVLRFSLPVIAAVPVAHIPLLLLVAILLYGYLRWLGYLDSKGLLTMPDRKARWFGLVQTILMLPLLALLAWVSQSSLVLELWFYLAVLFAGWSFLGRNGSGQQTADHGRKADRPRRQAEAE